MQKLNIGNMTTNAMQTLSIAATTATGMHRANEDRKLVNKLSGRKYLSRKDMEMIGKSRAEAQKGAALETLNNKKVEQEGVKAMKDIPDVQAKKTKNEETRVIRVNSPQGEQLNNYIENNISAYEFLTDNTENKNEDRFIKTREEDDNADV